MTLIYNLQMIDEIVNEGFTLELPDTTLEIINTIASVVGASTYVKTPVFHKKSNKKKDIQPSTPKPKIERPENVEKKRELQTNLNKLTDSNIDKLENEIMELIKYFDDHKENNEDFVQIIEMLLKTTTITVASGFAYAMIMKKILDKYENIKDLVFEKLEAYLNMFDNIVYTSADDDYEKFCSYNQECMKRKGISYFIYNLTKLKLYDSNDLDELIIKILDDIFIICKESGKNVLVEQLSENLLVLICGDSKYSPTELLDNCEIRISTLKSKIVNIKDLSKETNPSFTNKLKFKMMDILDIINKKK